MTTYTTDNDDDDQLFSSCRGTNSVVDIDNLPEDVDWKEFQIHDGDEEGKDDEFNTYATHNMFQRQDDSDDEDYYETYQYMLKPSQSHSANEAPLRSIVSIRHREETANSTGLGLWTGAEILCQYLQDHPDLIRGKNVVELGAGVGLCGLVAHALGASHVTMTDGDSVVLKNLRYNMAKNGITDPAKIQCKQLIWGRKHVYPFIADIQPADKTDDPCEATAVRRNVDVVMASDCIYMTQSLIPLWETVSSLLSPASESVPNKNGEDSPTLPFPPGAFLYVNMCSSQAPLSMVLDTATKFQFSWETVAPQVVLFRKQVNSASLSQ